MGKRNTPSSIDKLPPEIQELIGALRRSGRTIDEILSKLRELDSKDAWSVSRSALGRHLLKLQAATEQVKRSRAVAEALVTQFGDEPDSKVARANIELMHGLVMNVLTNTEEDEATGQMKPITLAPEDAMFLASAIQKLASAEKTNDDRITKARDAAVAAAAKRAGAAAKSKGLSKDTVEFITAKVLGTE